MKALDDPEAYDKEAICKYNNTAFDKPPPLVLMKGTITRPKQAQAITQRNQMTAKFSEQL
jgi:hypothetical protein